VHEAAARQLAGIGVWLNVRFAPKS